MAAVTFDSLRQSLAKRQYAPIYLLHGEEAYYVDALVAEFEKVLTEDEKVFNQFVLFAPQVEPTQVIDICHRMPMMADYQVVILKEAQGIPAAKLAKLQPYFANPAKSTILVVCCRGAVAKGKELIASAKANGVVFEAQKVKDYQVPALISSYVKEKGLIIEPKAVDMLHEFVGSDLSRLYNEIDKLVSILGRGAAVTPESVERNVGVSKDYNSFELVDAIAVKDAPKIFRIISYFQSNPKAAPLVMTTASIFGLFSDLLIAYYTQDRSDSGLMASLGYKNTFALRRIRTAMTRYNPFQIIEIISAIRDFDIKSKGVGSRQNEHQLFHDLMYHILTAPGKI